MEKDTKNVGGLWKGKTKKGDACINIILSVDSLTPGPDGLVRLIAFKNDYKEPGDEKKPDFKVYKRNETKAPVGKAKAPPAFDDPFA